MDYQFWIPLLLLTAAMAVCERKWCLLRDLTQPKPQPYSWSRVQLAWWTVIILSAFIAIIWKGHADPSGAWVHDAVDLPRSAVVLLGISSLTTITARTMDANSDVVHTGNGESFFLDILSDHNGVSIARFQTVVFNFVFGIWFIAETAQRLAANAPADTIMPPITDNNLILLGMSSAAYAAMKLTENKEKAKADAIDGVDGSPATTPTLAPASLGGASPDEMDPAVG
jgi:hypothetical protein